jgi:CheY-like chemotaxis protein
MPGTAVLIDDDQEDLDLMREAIAVIDPTVACIPFLYPEEALKALLGAELDPHPDFIFIDINMPVLTGEKCLKLIRAEERFDQVIVTMYSTSMPANVAAALVRAGANHVFEKPVRLSAYRDQLSGILGA